MARKIREVTELLLVGIVVVVIVPLAALVLTAYGTVCDTWS